MRTQPTQQDNPTHWVERRWFPADDVMVIERPETVVVRFSSFKEGVTRSGKKWSRWSTSRLLMFSVRPGRSGERGLRVYTYERNKRGTFFQNRTASIADLFRGGAGSGQLTRAVDGLWERNIGQVPEPLIGADMPTLVAGLAFPGLAGQPEPLFGWNTEKPLLPAGLGSAWRATNARDMTVRLFGVKRARKDLIRAVASADPHRVAVAHAVRSHVPVDWLVEYLRDPEGEADYRWDRKGLGLAFSLIDPTARRRLLLQATVPVGRKNAWAMSSEARIIGDTAHIVQRLLEFEIPVGEWVTDEFRKPKTWKGLHDEAARLERLLRRPARTVSVIPQTRIAKTLDGQVITGTELRLVSAKQTDELWGWGDRMSNCIGGYGHQAVNGDSNLFAVYSGADLLANMEVTPDGRIQQLFGRFNQPLAKEQDTVIRGLVTRKLEAKAASTRQPKAVAA